MKKLVKCGVVFAVVGAIFAPSASAASPTMAQFKALKSTVTTLKSQLAATKSQLAATKSQLDATTAAANGAAEGVEWYDACLVYYDLDQYEGYAYERPGGFATTTTFDFAGQGRDGLIGDEIGRARPYHFTAFDAFNDACVIDSGEGWAGEPLAAHHRGGRAVVRSK